MIWSTFLRNWIFGPNAKWGGGGQGLAERFGALLKDFVLLDFLKKVYFYFGLMSKGEGGGRAKAFGTLFWGMFDHLRLSKRRRGGDGGFSQFGHCPYLDCFFY